MPETWCNEPQILDSLLASIPEILADQKSNGQFGDEPWICRDQHRMFALAAVWQLPGNDYYHDPAVLKSIVHAGDALIEDQDEQGMWTFRKKDHSTWGQIYMPWTYSRWIRTYRIIREHVDASTQIRWDAALTLGFEGIARHELERIHNIPAHHAMALFCAGEVLKRPEWQDQASDFLRKVVAEQSHHGWWTEHVGPVVAYNYVYVDALGVYYSLSGDDAVLDALERSARFHANYTYPDGSMVETVDERNPYHAGIHLGNPGFSYTDAGRGYLAQQHALHIASGGTFDEDYAANMILFAGEGLIEETAGLRERHVFRMDDDALVVRHKPWFVSYSAYTCAPHETRWRQDRQNFVSIFHDRAGLILGGGNTKLQPLWSTCTVGYTGLLFHVDGEEEPDFSSRPGLQHVPDMAEPGEDSARPSLTLNFGLDAFKITCIPETEKTLSIVCEASSISKVPMAGHLTLMPVVGEPVHVSDEIVQTLGETPVTWQAEGTSGWLEHNGWRISLPEGSRLDWPVLPHNPYRKQGDATVEEARIVISLPFSVDRDRYDLTLSVL